MGSVVHSLDLRAAVAVAAAVVFVCRQHVLELAAVIAVASVVVAAAALGSFEMVDLGTMHGEVY